jgi:hypothetical protein
VLSKGAQTQFYVYGEDSDPVTGYISGDSSTIWEMTSEANFNNAYLSDDSIAKDIAPGRWGYVDFYIIPITTGSIDISCEIDLTAYGSGDSENLTDEEKTVNKIVSGNTEYYPLSLTSDEDFDSLLKGHLMFFTEDSQSEDGSLKWLSPDENGKLSFEVCADITEDYKVISDDSDLQGYKAVRVRIYWVWASVFGQTVLDSNSLSVLEGNYKPVSQLLSEMAGEGLADEDIVKSDFQRLMAEDSAYKYFFLSEDRTSVEDSKNSGLGLNGTALNAKSYNLLKQAWNSADQLIGNNVSFVTVELTASEATS